MQKILLAIMTCVLGVIPALASDIDKSKLPDEAIYKAMLEANKSSGWVGFRNFNGKQLVYFSPLQTMHCRLEEIRYSINSQALDKRFDLVKCNPQLPFSLPDGAGLEAIAVSFPLNTAKSVAVQVIWDDGKESEILNYEPCKDVGEQTCAQLIE